ncbi:MAG: hypothetical protein HKN60_05505 [Rhizobiales bacterium]|nr:hypothetical protein [Hyphomicrobiales bacterium]
MVGQLEFRASEPVRAALAGLGRTEDVRFSPNNELLVIAGFARDCLLVLSVRIEDAPSGPGVAVDDFMELTSGCINSVHGIDFIDDRTLVLANRDGMVSIMELPPGPPGGRSCQVDAVREVSGSHFGRIRTPGSVAVSKAGNGKITLLVCNNYVHTVTRHVLSAGPKYRVRKNRTLLKQGLKIPDGIALSHDQRWIAVSNHARNCIHVFDAATRLDRNSAPAAVLRNANFPHGLRFTNDGSHILVADAGAPLIHVYQRGGADWQGDYGPSHSAIVLDDPVFQRGRYSPEEGGPKGIDIDRSGRILALTCEHLPLAFFELGKVCIPAVG